MPPPPRKPQVISNAGRREAPYEYRTPPATAIRRERGQENSKKKARHREAARLFLNECQLNLVAEAISKGFSKLHEIRQIDLPVAIQVGLVVEFDIVFGKAKGICKKEEVVEIDVVIIVD